MTSAWDRWAEMPAADREAVKARARQLAKPPQIERAGERLTVLELETGSLRCVIPLSAVDGVDEVTHLAPVPWGPPSLRGLLSFRGEVLVAVDLGALLEEPIGASDLRRLVVLRDEGMRAAFLVTKVLSVHEVMREDFRSGLHRDEQVVAGLDSSMRALLSVATLLTRALRGMGEGQ